MFTNYVIFILFEQILGSKNCIPLNFMCENCKFFNISEPVPKIFVCHQMDILCTVLFIANTSNVSVAEI